ncbi:MAG TPA: ETC complex I subunit [Alphaproteobacteria bacterium]|nr:ETC complex I subunit [Alphaproteobacteria bacterium]
MTKVETHGARAIIRQPARSAMQAGLANTRQWMLQFVPSTPREIEPLMGWTSSSDTLRQVTLYFSTKEEAVAYAERHGISYTLEEPKQRQVRPKSYADNFRYDRRVPWSH